jgi:hypothetical protein
LSITVEAPSADVVIEIDRQPGWFYYTYNMIHQANGVVLAVGRIDAVNVLVFVCPTLMVAK